jgi:hypothetical protein
MFTWGSTWFRALNALSRTRQKRPEGLDRVVFATKRNERVCAQHNRTLHELCIARDIGAQRVEGLQRRAGVTKPERADGAQLLKLARAGRYWNCSTAPRNRTLSNKPTERSQHLRVILAPSCLKARKHEPNWT